MNKRQQKEQKTAVKLKINSFRTHPLLISVLFDVLVELMEKKNIEANKKAQHKFLPQKINKNLHKVYLSS